MRHERAKNGPGMLVGGLITLASILLVIGGAIHIGWMAPG